MLALNGKTSRSILSCWLHKHEVPIWEANEWNELTRVLQELFKPTYMQNMTYEPLDVTTDTLNREGVKMTNFIIVIDIGMLNITTDIWKEQLNFLDAFNISAKFAWILNHDTSNTIKVELRKHGHLLMVNGPLYKTKMTHIIEAVIKESNLDQSKKNFLWTEAHATVQINSTNTKSSHGSEITETNSVRSSHIEETYQENCVVNGVVSNCFPELTEVGSEGGRDNSNCEQQIHQVDQKIKSRQKDLEGLHILLAEDQPILQRVATMMLEQMGAKVVIVGDGVQAVEALNIQKEVEPRYDLILMDCQVHVSVITTFG